MTKVQKEILQISKDLSSINPPPFKKIDETSIVYYPELQHSQRKGIVVLDTHENLRHLLKQFDIKIRYNLMTRKREIFIPEQFVFSDDQENSSLNRIIYLATLNYMPIKSIDTHLDMLSHEDAYHPIVECLKSNIWDGVPRLDNFLNTIKTRQPQAKKLIRTWMLSAIGAALSKNGFSSQGVLVLQGDQGIGKTTWIKNLDPINCGAIKDGAFLDPSNKDSVIQLASFWIAELGELEANFNKSEIGRLKSYLTSSFDYVRFPYARRPTELPRRTVFAASVNEANFLVDQTGNRRWWVVEVDAIDNDHGINMVQVWAEVLHYYSLGESVYLSHDDQFSLNVSNEEHEKNDPLEELVSSHYDWESTARRKLTATEVLIELGYSKPNKSEATRMGYLLKRFSGKPSKRSSTVDRRRLFEVPHQLTKI